MLDNDGNGELQIGLDFIQYQPLKTVEGEVIKFDRKEDADLFCERRPTFNGFPLQVIPNGVGEFVVWYAPWAQTKHIV